MDNLVSILKIPTLNMEIKNKILQLVQNWSAAFEGKPTLSYTGTVHKVLTNEGEYTLKLLEARMTSACQATSSHPRISPSRIRPW